jgi:hypothetical protein
MPTPRSILRDILGRNQVWLSWQPLGIEAIYRGAYEQTDSGLTVFPHMVLSTKALGYSQIGQGDCQELLGGGQINVQVNSKFGDHEPDGPIGASLDSYENMVQDLVAELASQFRGEDSSFIGATSISLAEGGPALNEIPKRDKDVPSSAYWWWTFDVRYGNA